MNHKKVLVCYKKILFNQWKILISRGKPLMGLAKCRATSSSLRWKQTADSDRIVSSIRDPLYFTNFQAAGSFGRSCRT